MWMLFSCHQFPRSFSGSSGIPEEPIFLNGELALDFPEDVRIPLEPNQMATAVLSGSRIKFSYCGLDRAIALLKEQYAVGTVEVRIMRSKA